MMTNFCLRCCALMWLTVAAAQAATTAQFYYIEDEATRKSLVTFADRIPMLSPVWFLVRADGRLEESVDRKLVEWAAERRMAMHPVVANQEFDPRVVAAVVRDPAVEKRLSDSLLALCARHGFHGLQIDFENIAPADRDLFSQFVARLAARLQRVGRKLSVAVGAPLAPASEPNAARQEFTASEHAKAYDYRALAKAADFLTLMAYDEYTAPGQPGPVAGLPWVKACIEKTLEEVPASRLMLGIALYHRHWSGRTVSTGPVAEARRIAAQRRVSSQYHEVHQERYLEFQAEGVSHRIWYPDAAAVETRVKLVAQYGLAGFSAWRLGQEDAGVWPAVSPASASAVPRIERKNP